MGRLGIATATPAAPVRETPVTAAPLRPGNPWSAANRGQGRGDAVQALNGQPTQPKPELAPVPPAAELVVPAAPELTAVRPRPN